MFRLIGVKTYANIGHYFGQYMADSGFTCEPYSAFFGREKVSI